MAEHCTFWLTRLLFQRALGLVYLIAFIAIVNQFRPLVGERGLLPVQLFIKQVSFSESPSLFFFCPTDRAFGIAGWLGIVLSCLALTGVADRFSLGISMAVWASLWVLYLSFVNVGQTFYGFGWESILLEAGFYALFLGPQHTEPPRLTIWMLRWLLFRVMFGAGLIKLRGDECWRTLSCLQHHYETQPMPNPLSWYAHWAPDWTQRAGVIVNHVTELVVPFGYFCMSAVSAAAGAATIVFQTLIMATGNLSWLNVLTIVIAIPTLADRWLNLFFPIEIATTRPDSLLTGIALGAAILTAALSVQPIRNLFSSRQAMNQSYNPLHLVGTYGAFGQITRERYEIVIEGTEDAAITPATVWRAYEFKGKPGALERRPPQIAPYQLRLDWLMWFAAMSGSPQHPWFVHLVEKLLTADAPTLGLLRGDPFHGRRPRFVRAELYAYHFTTPTQRRDTGRWWTRHWVGEYFPPVSIDTPAFRRALDAMGWT